MQRGGQDLQMRELLDTIRELRLTIEALRKELNAKEKQMEIMQEQLNSFQKKLFGTSSEKHSLAIEGQLGLFDEVESEAAKETAPEPDAEEEPAASPRPRRPRTRKEELLRGIPVTEKIVDLPEAEKICPKCGAELQPTGRKFLRDEIHFVPAKVTVTRIYAQTYSCPECRREAAKAGSNAQNSLVTAAVPPALIPAQHGDGAGGGACHVPEVCERGAPLPAGNGLGAVWTAAVPRTLSQMDPNLFGGLLPPRVCVSAPPAAAEEVPDGRRDANPGAQRAAACGGARFVPLGLPQRR